jgi:hypothetical protein
MSSLDIGIAVVENPAAPSNGAPEVEVIPTGGSRKRKVSRDDGRG